MKYVYRICVFIAIKFHTAKYQSNNIWQSTKYHIFSVAFVKVIFFRLVSGGIGNPLISPPPPQRKNPFLEPVFVNLLRSPGIDSQSSGPERQPYWSYRPARLHRRAESIPGLLERLQIRAPVSLYFFPNLYKFTTFPSADIQQKFFIIFYLLDSSVISFCCSCFLFTFFIILILLLKV